MTSVYKVTPTQAVLLRARKQTHHVMLPFWFCMGWYILHCTSTSSHVIYSTAQHDSDRHPIYKDPRKFWNKWWPSEKKIRKCIFCRNQWKNSHIPRWNRGLRIVIWSFHWYTYLVFFTPLPYLCLYALFTRTNQGGRSGGWETVHVWMCVGAFTVQRSLVCMWWMR